jgi:LysM repeat protein
MKKFFYRVEKGDTVTFIAQKFLTPVSLIIFDNNLKKEVLEGDLLVIKKRNGKLYRVAAVESIEDIAKKFLVSCRDILEYNKTPIVYFGQEILIP